MKQGVLPFQYVEEKSSTGMTGLLGLPVSRVSMSSDYVRLSGQGKCPSRPLSYHRTVIRGT